MKKYFLLSLLILFGAISKAQEGRLSAVINSDTVSIIDTEIQVFVLMDKDTVKFHNGSKLKYPSITDDSEITAILVKLEGKYYEFFNHENSTLPKEIIAVMGPFYLDLFQNKRNMVIILSDQTDVYDDYPKELEADIEKYQKKEGRRFLTIYYQIQTLVVIEN